MRTTLSNSCHYGGKEIFVVIHYLRYIGSKKVNKVDSKSFTSALHSERNECGYQLLKLCVIGVCRLVNIFYTVVVVDDVLCFHF